MNRGIVKLLRRQESIVLIFSAVVFAVFSIFSDNFFTPNNVRLIFQQYAVNGICVLGVSLVVLLGGIDLSAGSILAVAGSVVGTLVKAGLDLSLAILVAVGMGTFLGFVNAVVITKLGVPPIITTLATNFAYRGILVLLTGGFWVNAFPKAFTRIATGRILNLSNVF